MRRYGNLSLLLQWNAVETISPNGGINSPNKCKKFNHHVLD